MGGKFAVRATGLWGEMPAGLAPVAKRRFIICEALQAFSAVMAMLGVIEVKYDGARQLKWFKCAAVWHNVIFWPRLIFSTSSAEFDSDLLMGPPRPLPGLRRRESVDRN
jgi:hypothetical protein